MFEKALGFVDVYRAVLRWWFLFTAMCVGAYFGYETAIINWVFIQTRYLDFQI